ncbi:MAG: glutathione binding-like protein [Gammaproteobacteria bacterium]|nr:glutathione binding-like protein [Gammaproteobacteria bacterium]
MIDLYYWTTPNGHKITIFLEEAGIPYQIKPVNIGAGDQFKPEFLRISPNNKMPAIVDQKPADHSAPLSIFESGAILLYLADKTKKFIPEDLHGRNEVIEWLFWQAAGLGPMAGQNHHFTQYAPEKIPYAIDRYVKETARLYAVLDKQLAKKEFIAGKYSIADMASFPWVKLYDKQMQNIEDFPHIKRWLDLMMERPAVKKAYAIADEINPQTEMTEEAKRILFGQNASTVRGK